MRPFLTLAAVLLGAGQALASGGISCQTDATPADITLQAGVTHGMGAPIFSFQGLFKTSDDSVPADLRSIDFGRENVAQYWLDGKELRLVLYREREGDQPHGYVEVAILTEAGQEGTYVGHYTATVFDMTPEPEGHRTELAGRISCLVE